MLNDPGFHEQLHPRRAVGFSLDDFLGDLHVPAALWTLEASSGKGLNGHVRVVTPPRQTELGLYKQAERGLVLRKLPKVVGRLSLSRQALGLEHAVHMVHGLSKTNL